MNRFTVAALSVPLAAAAVVPTAQLPGAPYHKWAHGHWVWNHNGAVNQENTTAIVQQYLDHGIPVSAVNIDSTWATQFNNFEPDTAKFPDFKSMVSDLHAKNVNVLLWATSMVNVENPDYQFCVDNGYLVRDSRGEVRPIGWWHGSGALLDYSNPEAVAWWHSKLDYVLDAGVDGWKADGTDPYIIEYILGGGALGYQNVSLTYRDYANYYYRDFLYYTREKRGPKGLVMSRPVDCQIDKSAMMCTPFSPLDVMYSGWVGDDDSTFNGLRGAISKIIYSAWDGYANFGSDIGGYRDPDEGNDRNVFIRWAQFGAFVPLMENGGGGIHKPWEYDEEISDIYRKYVLEHYKLSSYLHTTGSYAAINGVSSVTPLAHRDDSKPWKMERPSTYSYLLGADLLVHPVVADTLVGGLAPVTLTFPPAAADSTDSWLDWWRPVDTSRMHHSGEEESKTLVRLDEYPVFVRRGALLPLDEEYDAAAAVASDVQFTWFGAVSGSSARADVLEPTELGPGVRCEAALSADGVFSASISAHPTRKAGWTVMGVSEPSGVSFSHKTCTSKYNKHSMTFTAKCAGLVDGATVTATGMTSLM